MQKPLFEKLRGLDRKRHRERGVTIALVALAMVAIIGMAALSIDVVTLYLAKEEAQRSADAAALTAARILSVSGITGDPSNLTGNWLQICGPDDGTNGIATRAAKSVVAQNTVG
jgi:Flp pilus assembly protein TadG